MCLDTTVASLSEWYQPLAILDGSDPQAEVANQVNEFPFFCLKKVVFQQCIECINIPLLPPTEKDALGQINLAPLGQSN